MITRTPSPHLDESLERWQHAGLIDHDEADAIRRFEHRLTNADFQAASTPQRRIPVVSEALGYLGGMLGVVGLTLLITRYWPHLGTPARLALAGGAAALLLAAGALVPHHDEPALERLRSFLWLGATAAAAVAGGVFAHGVLDSDHAVTVLLAGAVMTTVVSGALWGRHARPVQQTSFLLGLLVVAGATGDLMFTEGVSGLLVWVVAATMLAIGVLHGSTDPIITMGIGAAGAMIGAAMTIPASRGDGLVFFMLTTSTVLALATMDWLVTVRAERILLAVMGAFSMFQAVPQTVAWFARDAGIATGLTVFAVGATLVLLGRRPTGRGHLAMQLVGGVALVAGPAITSVESVAFATSLGLLVAIGLIGLGTLPGNVMLSLFGCLGLLVNVPWAIAHFFPGQGRAPLLIAVSGVLIVAVAVWLSRQGRALHSAFRE